MYENNWVNQTAKWWAILSVLLLVLAPVLAAQPPERSEIEWAADLALTVNGETEYRLPDGSRIDILTGTEAIEVEWSDKWPEAIGQSIYYSLASGKQPSVWLLLRGNYDEDYLRCLMVCRELNIKLRTKRAY